MKGNKINSFVCRGLTHFGHNFILELWYRLRGQLARFDFSWGDIDYHQETLENLKLVVKSTKKLCAHELVHHFQLGVH
ncbi:hypothetical protein J5N97_009472 [Dioscorea zingiberensis]|uniref:Uncharacterized protein n=1 Tax=Dioscorea zingiberensis TaxID=325984 RepID=A0A9D5CYC6_9LILI|nr:hypothetical protein J5N97_009472 [Dioscorea zingiberensis]